MRSVNVLIFLSLCLVFVSCAGKVHRPKPVQKTKSRTSEPKEGWERYILRKNEFSGWNAYRVERKRKKKGPEMTLLPMNLSLVKFLNEMKKPRYYCKMVAHPNFIYQKKQDKNYGVWVYQLFKIESCEER